MRSHARSTRENVHTITSLVLNWHPLNCSHSLTSICIPIATRSGATAGGTHHRATSGVGRATGAHTSFLDCKCTVQVAQRRDSVHAQIIPVPTTSVLDLQHIAQLTRPHSITRKVLHSHATNTLTFFLVCLPAQFVCRHVHLRLDSGPARISRIPCVGWLSEQYGWS